jgi:pyrroline-5-carboxylate reductase
MTNHIHFIGGGRITNIFLQAFKDQSVTFNKISVTDTDDKVLSNLKANFSEIKISKDNAFEIENADLIFVALHPPVFMENLSMLKTKISNNATIVSLAPKITIQKIQDVLEIKKVIRMIPTALTITGNGYNPVSFSNDFSNSDKEEFFSLCKAFGNNFETAEEKLEAYAISTAMSPTYYWFQFFELIEIAQKMGLTQEEATKGIVETLKASLDIITNSDFTKEEILDFIPVKPLTDMEEFVIDKHQEKLLGLFAKIKP